MAKKPRKSPKLVHHKARDLARVRIDGHDYYLGRWGSQEAVDKYNAVVGVWMSTGKLPEDMRRPEPQVAQAPLTVNGLLLRYLEHAESYYVKDGKPTDELACYKSAIAPVKHLYGTHPVGDFGPLALKAVRDAMITRGWTRGYINRSISRIKCVWSWGVSEQIIEPHQLKALETVKGLRAGKTKAKDNPAREAVPAADIEAVKAVLRSQRTIDLIDLMLRCWARPGELLGLRARDVDRSGDVWVVRLKGTKRPTRERNERSILARDAS